STFCSSTTWHVASPHHLQGFCDLTPCIAFGFSITQLPNYALTNFSNDGHTATTAKNSRLHNDGGSHFTAQNSSCPAVRVLPQGSGPPPPDAAQQVEKSDRKSTRLNSSH